MIYTKQQFKALWDNGSDIYFKDVADCAKDWGLYDDPYFHDKMDVMAAVCNAAGCDD